MADDKLATVGKRKLEAEVVLYSGSPEISRELEKAQTLATNDFYSVAGKTVASARALQWLANRKQIKTRIVDIQSDKNYCRATIAGWIGNHSEPRANHIYKEATVEMIFELELAEKLLEMIDRHNYRNPRNKLERGVDWDIDTEGKPYFINSEYQQKMMKEMLRMRKFALRTIVTKAERIIHSKLADVEWRDEDEMLDEQHEVEMVSGKKITEPKKATKQPKVVEPQTIVAEDIRMKPDEPEAEEPVKPYAPEPMRPMAYLTKDKPIETPEQDEAEDEANRESVNKPQEPPETQSSDLPYVSKATIEKMTGKTPREAYDIMETHIFGNGEIKELKDVVLGVIPEYHEKSMQSFQIPETALIAMIKKLTGLKLKPVEKAKTCKVKGCKNKITPPEAEEHDGKCPEHFAEGA